MRMILVISVRLIWLIDWLIKVEESRRKDFSIRKHSRHNYHSHHSHHPHHSHHSHAHYSHHITHITSLTSLKFKPLTPLTSHHSYHITHITSHHSHRSTHINHITQTTHITQIQTTPITPAHHITHITHITSLVPVWTTLCACCRSSLTEGKAVEEELVIPQVPNPLYRVQFDRRLVKVFPHQQSKLNRTKKGKTNQGEKTEFQWEKYKITTNNFKTHTNTH